MGVFRSRLALRMSYKNSLNTIIYVQIVLRFCEPQRGLATVNFFWEGRVFAVRLLTFLTDRGVFWLYGRTRQVADPTRARIYSPLKIGPTRVDR